MLKKILIIAFLTNLVFLFPNAFAIDCKLCSVGACFCNVTDCSTGSISIFLTPNKCTGIPIKEFTFKNSSFVWIDAQAKNYYFQVFCDSGTKSNCTNVNLISTNVTTTTTTISSTTSTTTTLQKSACLFDCCVGDSQYFNKYCDEGYECIDNQCVTTTTTTTTTTTENPPQIPYSLIGGVVILILVAVFVYYFFKGREPKEKWSELYNKYGKR
jgi:hypothetical protein